MTPQQHADAALQLWQSLRALPPADRMGILMAGLPGYDDWKTHNPDDDRCEFCGVAPWECRGGWQPDRCTGECRRAWRDPDFEYEQVRDEK